MLRVCSDCGSCFGCYIANRKIECGDDYECAMARVTEMCDKENPEAREDDTEICDRCYITEFKQIGGER